MSCNIKHYLQVSSVYLIPIERMIILLFENYPKLGKRGMFLYEKGLARFIRVLAQNANVFKVCLSQIGEFRYCSCVENTSYRRNQPHCNARYS